MITKPVIVFDNYDSFTHNLLHLLHKVRPEYNYIVLRNNDKSLFKYTPKALIIGPGPMTPAETGLLDEYFSQIIEQQNIPVLGVCLGLQYLAFRKGIEITRSTMPAHGAAVEIIHNSDELFQGVQKEFQGARYNSLEVVKDDIEADSQLQLTAYAAENNAAMAFYYKDKPWTGVQFHPESFLTLHGDKIIDNFFKQYVEV
jgi:anthranilate synthase/aminodeoxychorismate synthase-like glutamine amidotransferase